MKPYFYLAALLILTGGLWGLYHMGYKKGEAAQYEKQVKAVKEAEAKTDIIQGRLRDLQVKHDAQFKQEEAKHKSELAAALANVKPVRVCNNRPSSGTLSTVPVPTGGASPTGGHPDLPVPIERDIGPALVVLAGDKCQSDRDARVALYNRWLAIAKESRK